MEVPLLEPDLAKEVEALQAEYGIAVEQRTVRRAGFAGQAELIVITKFIITATAAGLLKKLGEEIWGRLRSVVARLFGRKDPDLAYQVVFEVRTGNVTTYTSFLCTVKGSEDLTKMQLFREALQLELARNPDLAQFRRTEYQFRNDGSWHKHEQL